MTTAQLTEADWLLGHASLATTQRYIHASRDDLFEGVDVL